MNWTGGRLHRHSTTNAPKHKHKGQAIRKPTQGPQQVTLFHKFKQTKAQDPDKHTSNDKDNQTSHQKQSPTILASLSPNHRSSKESTRLESIKHQLLAKTDWAAVSAARPLKMTFPPLEEQFGKRRKLTEADRRRLDKSDNQVFRGEGPLFRYGFRKNETLSKIGTIDGLEIRINGKNAGVDQVPAFEDIQQSNLSSQPMLLDREETVLREPSRTSMVTNVMSEDMPTGEYSSVIPDYHSSRTSLLSSPSNIWISQSRVLSGCLSDY
ncbi:hypothetical protein F9C07_3785 [Aspergillus flavus]|uniref:Uncharacterized protein n=1 Tax=Aspergillus flavus (strain ATCC 200026 / FGSC A1120 / IAM 13836 / NRRL 3357 / JCM 12722 / SRRC 167) TaxID=332952 RepID=A0A7U2MUY7_ASPFN|nr:hypothetical protein AFLA_002367 [Aspergillus flavus NRRL3357]QRD89990.1 hypothetical protein F9C07_3785 [Aspergillus flavus]